MRGDDDDTIHLTCSPDEVKAYQVYIKHDLGAALDAALDAKPWRRSKLRFPGDREAPISAYLSWQSVFGPILR